MSRRIFIALLISLPFIWFAAFAYAAWQEPPPGVTPPGGNLNGPVWFLPDITAEQQTEAGANPGLNISGVIQTTGNIKTDAKLIGRQAELTPTSGIGLYSIANYVAGVAIRGQAVTPAVGGAAVAGFGYGNPSLADITDPNYGAWAGYFSDYLFAKWLCLADGSDAGTDKDCIDSWSDVADYITATGDTFWNREGATKNIFKAPIDGSLDGIVAIGTNTPSTAGFALGTRLGIVGVSGSGPRLYLSNSTGNPEINLGISGGGHWAVYTDTTTSQLRFWQGDTNRVVFTTTGNVGIGTTSPSEKLELSTAGRSLLSLRGDTTANWVGTVIRDTTGAEKWFIGGNGGNLLLRRNGTTNDLVVSSGGNIGIGTNSPVSLLDVAGNFRLMGNTGSLIRSGVFGSSNMVSGNSNDKWIKVAEFTLTGAWNAAGVFIDFYPKNSNHGDSRQQLSAQIRNGPFTNPPTNTTTRIEATFDLVLNNLTSGNAPAIKDAKMVWKCAAAPCPASTTNVVVLWVQIQPTWLSSVPILVQHYGNITTLNLTNQPQVTDITPNDGIGGDVGEVFSLQAAAGPGSTYWTLNGTNLYTTTTSWNVGIGTTTPGAKLDIAPGLAAATTIGGQTFNLGQRTLTTSSRSGYVAQTANDYLDSALGNGAFVALFPFNNSANSDDKSWKAFRLMTESTLVDKFWVNKYGEGYFAGNVGIGTATPQAALHLAGTTPVMVFDGWPILNTLTLTVTGSGIVTDSLGSVSCNPTCSGSYASGTTVIFTASPQGGATFNGWGPPCSGVGNCTILISGATSLSASFSAAPPSVSVTLTALPSSGEPPLNVSLRASVSGTATGSIRYQFDCTNNGTFESDITTNTNPYTAVNLCNYPAGTWTAKVIVTRQGVTATATRVISVGAPG